MRRLLILFARVGYVNIIDKLFFSLYNIYSNEKESFMNINEKYKEITVYDLENANKLIVKDWMLITARDGDGANAMTASWGGLGELWNTHVAFCFVRPERYTCPLIEKDERISLAFFDEEYRPALTFCGKNSGRDMDKLAAAGLTTSEIDGVPVINEAKTLLICRKLYADDIKESCFIDKDMLKYYEEGGFHRFYVMEVEKVLVKE